MKRLCLLDLLVIMSSFLALLNHHSFLAMMIMLAGVISIYSLLKDTTYTVFTLVFTISLLMISLLGIMGDLDKLYRGFGIYAILFTQRQLTCSQIIHRTFTPECRLLPLIAMAKEKHISLHSVTRVTLPTLLFQSY